MPLLFFVALLVFHHLVNPSLVSFTAQKTQAPNKPHKLLNNQVNKFPIYNLQARGNRNITEQNSEQKKCDDTQRMDCDFTSKLETVE